MARQQLGGTEGISRQVTLKEVPGSQVPGTSILGNEFKESGTCQTVSVLVPKKPRTQHC